MLAWMIAAPILLALLVLEIVLMLGENIALCFDPKAPEESEDEPR